MLSTLAGLILILSPIPEPKAFVAVKAGKYTVGDTIRLDNFKRTVTLKAFEIARYETTNSEFEAFVKATKYVTDAERKHDAMVFDPPMEEFRWTQDKTAFWRFPNGKARGGIGDKMDHPVTCISYHDAQEYCKWAGVRLPTLDEWEVASRAGAKTDFFFGKENTEIGQYANVWHGRDHTKPDLSDGYMYTSPVGKFKPNPWGLYDIYGNVFEFCSGRVESDTSERSVHARGGSWWCSKNACNFFNSVDIGKMDIRASFSNQGFRVVKGK
ncbi:MAG: SUMF1/EgtB/PvdO family nonheme iron enzyme [Fimbriimonadaceae bacterium]|nr:SUMF1/EgtB/PvdO family nonheme iron enzyme [Fimbriimonadaceae bacterium]